MYVTQIKPTIMTLDFRQERKDPDYGTCLWARFYFNLDRYELNISSDCGNYGYKWPETPETESFLELMSRINSGYLLEKLYGAPDVFDYKRTKESIKGSFANTKEEEEKINAIFEELELDGTPETGTELLMRIENADVDDFFKDAYLYEDIIYSYPARAVKICEIFQDSIQPAIARIREQEMSQDDEIEWLSP